MVNDNIKIRKIWIRENGKILQLFHIVLYILQFYIVTFNIIPRIISNWLKNYSNSENIFNRLFENGLYNYAWHHLGTLMSISSEQEHVPIPHKTSSVKMLAHRFLSNIQYALDVDNIVSSLKHLKVRGGILQILWILGGIFIHFPI